MNNTLLLIKNKISFLTEKFKYLILFIIVLSCSNFQYISAQQTISQVDSLTITQKIDSLIKVSRDLTGKREFDKALEVNGVAEKIVLETFGRESASYGSCAFNRGRVNYVNRTLLDAEKWILESIKFRSIVLGTLHPDYATSLNLLGVVYIDMGNYAKAEPLYLEAKDIRAKSLGKDHPHYANSVNNLGVLYVDMGNYAKAEPLYLEAKDIRAKSLGKDHPDYAASLGNLGLLYNRMGNYAKAEPLYLEAIDIYAKSLGKDHDHYATSVNNLGLLYADMGSLANAEPLYLEAIDIRVKSLGKDHPDYAGSLNSLANLFERQGNFMEGEPLLADALLRSSSRMLNASSFLSENELAKYTATFQHDGNYLNSYIIARQAKKVQPGILPNLAYNHVLFKKGFLLTAASKLNIPTTSPTETIELNNELKSYRRRISQQLSKPIADRQNLEELEEKANTLEKELARSVAGYADALRQVNWKEVQATLHKSSIALEFVHFKVDFPQKTDSIMYAVLLLRPGAEQPQFIPLFEQKEIDHIISTGVVRKADYANQIYAWQDRGLTPVGESKPNLYELIWKKIEATGLDGINTVYYSPTGVLHRLNLGAIAIDDETTLSDRYNLIALNSTRQLVVPSGYSPVSNDAVLIGGVDYEGGVELASAETNASQNARSLASYWTETGTRGESWNYLRWTEKEAERIAATLDAKKYTTNIIKGKAASEEAFKTIGQGKASPRILHIATHGFFFPDPEVKSTPAFSDSEPVFKWSDNPMIRSGLILAGANKAWIDNKSVGSDREDGILTAYEISQMNLSNTELVVLSACETGLGDIQGNEGVYGLQRAFKIAGAKYLVMSLWQVPDRETMEFMTTFYKNWLEGEMTIPNAFRKTQKEMRERFINPYSWAGFVLVE